MNIVCPRCKNERDVPRGATSYTCAKCGTTWQIVKCVRCGASFHAQPGTEAWTCKRCGLRNLVDLGASEERGVVPAGASPARRPDLVAAWRRLPAVGKIVSVLAVVLVVAGVLTVILHSGGSGNAGGHGGATAADRKAHRTYCHDLTVLQDLGRPDAIARFQNKIKRDKVLYTKAHDSAAVSQLHAIGAAAAKLHTTLSNRTDAGPATAKLQQAIAAGPNC
jgi:DNA-directed RNA polymerase subunit RPC12/RpoP